MLNPDLDTKALAVEFAKDGRIRIENILTPGIAERVRSYCLTDAPFETVYHLDGENHVSPLQEMARMDPSQQHEFQTKIIKAASQGVGFVYCGYMIGRAKKNVASERLRYLHSIFEFLNGREMLDFICKVSGRDDLLSADAQYTRYTAGQFLTRHRDDVSNEKRRLAYVFAFSKDWHPDWGGLLQFYEDDGTPRDVWSPKFNSMSLFDIRHVHSVTYVTPFALSPRLSLTGWFRAIPL